MPVSVTSVTNDPTIQGLKMQLDMAAMKQEAIASNIANVNTPNYKRLDLSSSFQSEFQKAMSTLNSGQTLSSLPQPTLGEASTAGLTRFDGNNVNVDQELMDMMNNQSRFDFASKMLVQEYNRLRSAISGRAGG